MARPEYRAGSGGDAGGGAQPPDGGSPAHGPISNCMAPVLPVGPPRRVPSAIPAQDHDTRVLPKLASQGVRGAIRQEIARAVALEIHQDGALAPPLALGQPSTLRAGTGSSGASGARRSSRRRGAGPVLIDSAPARHRRKQDCPPSTRSRRVSSGGSHWHAYRSTGAAGRGCPGTCSNRVPSDDRCSVRLTWQRRARGRGAPGHRGL